PLCPSTHTAPSETYTLSLHDALPICGADDLDGRLLPNHGMNRGIDRSHAALGELPLDAILPHHKAGLEIGGHRQRHGLEGPLPRSEEHTSELQSPCNLVCRLLLEKKK